MMSMQPTCTSLLETVKPRRFSTVLSLLTAPLDAVDHSTMAVPSWKKRAEKRPPDIDDCVEQLLLLSDEKSKSIKTLGQLYVAALGLLYHLRLDQETIISIRYANRAR